MGLRDILSGRAKVTIKGGMLVKVQAVCNLEQMTDLNLTGNGDRVNVATDDLADEPLQSVDIIRQPPFI